jgi:hypothetical protein
MIGTPQPHLADVLAGRKVPSLDWLHAAAMSLGIDPADLDDRLASVRGRKG